MTAEFGRGGWLLEASDRRFGKARWPFEASGKRYLTKKTVPVENAVNVNIDILQCPTRYGLRTSFCLNVSLATLNGSPEIQDAVKKFLKIENFEEVDVKEDPSDLTARIEFRRHNDQLDHFLMHHR